VIFCGFFGRWWRVLFAGVFEKIGLRAWFFAGEFVVVCVVNVVRSQVVWQSKRVRHILRIYFCVR
jgi:hypothetical protein